MNIFFDREKKIDPVSRGIACAPGPAFGAKHTRRARNIAIPSHALANPIRLFGRYHLRGARATCSSQYAKVHRRLQALMSEQHVVPIKRSKTVPGCRPTPALRVYDALCCSVRGISESPGCAPKQNDSLTLVCGH